MKKYFVILALSFVAACGEKPQAPEKTQVAVAQKSDIELQDARIRIPPNGMSQTAAYVTIINNGDKAFKVISVNSDVAKDIQFHINKKTPDNMVSMQRVDGFIVPAKNNLELAPSGAHLMLIGISKDIKVGDSALLNLALDDGKVIKQSFKIVSNPEVQDKNNSKSAEHNH